MSHDKFALNTSTKPIKTGNKIDIRRFANVLPSFKINILPIVPEAVRYFKQNTMHIFNNAEEE